MLMNGGQTGQEIWLLSHPFSMSVGGHVIWNTLHTWSITSAQYSSILVVYHLPFCPLSDLLMVAFSSVHYCCFIWHKEEWSILYIESLPAFYLTLPGLTLSVDFFHRYHLQVIYVASMNSLHITCILLRDSSSISINPISLAIESASCLVFTKYIDTSRSLLLSCPNYSYSTITSLRRALESAMPYHPSSILLLIIPPNFNLSNNAHSFFNLQINRSHLQIKNTILMKVYMLITLNTFPQPSNIADHESGFL